MNSNPMLYILNLIKNGSSPQQVAMGLLEKQAQQNPFSQNLLSLVKNNRTDQLEMIARNLAREKGIDYDKSIGELVQILGVKK